MEHFFLILRISLYHFKIKKINIPPWTSNLKFLMEQWRSRCCLVSTTSKIKGISSRNSCIFNSRLPMFEIFKKIQNAPTKHAKKKSIFPCQKKKSPFKKKKSKGIFKFHTIFHLLIAHSHAPNISCWNARFLVIYRTA